MTATDLKLPERGFTKAERAWLAQLIEAIKTVRALQGQNCHINDTDNGQLVNVDGC